MTYDDRATKYWQRYERGKDHHNAVRLYTDVEKYHRFYIGDQWHGLKAAKEELPIFNFIKPVGKYKISMVAQNSMGIVYSDMGGAHPQAAEAANRFAARQWEKAKMDTLAWGMIKRAFIAGTNYLYCFHRDGELQHRLVGTTNVYLADEQNPDLNVQEYIILDERVSVRAVREAAKARGLSDEDIALIVSDENTETQVGERAEFEVKDELEKCTSILYMERTPEGLKFLRSVERVVYEPEQLIEGLDVYPLVGMRWEEQTGSARGVSGVKYMIPNQLEVNKTAARRAIAVKRFAFPTLVYDSEKIANADKLTEVGASIKVKNMAQNNLNTLIDYLSPAPISADAQQLQTEFIDITRELEGAGDAATGQVDPTKASGEAIKAARDQAAVPLNEQIASYRQFVEDLALLWYKLWAAYSGQGIQVQDEQGELRLIPREQLLKLDVDIKVDVSPIDPFSKISQEIALERLFQSGAVTFEEYVQALDDSSTVPKAKLEGILEQRRLAAEQEQSEITQTREQLAQTGILQEGGGENAMPAL